MSQHGKRRKCPTEARTPSYGLWISCGKACGYPVEIVCIKLARIVPSLGATLLHKAYHVSGHTPYQNARNVFGGAMLPPAVTEVIISLAYATPNLGTSDVEMGKVWTSRGFARKEKRRASAAYSCDSRGGDRALDFCYCFATMLSAESGISDVQRGGQFGSRMSVTA